MMLNRNFLRALHREKAGIKIFRHPALEPMNRYFQIRAASLNSSEGQLSPRPDRGATGWPRLKQARFHFAKFQDAGGLLKGARRAGSLFKHRQWHD
jgi:hypothetical protein